MTTEHVRLFLAIWPGVAARDAIAAVRDRFAWSANARPVADERLHVTLHFIGSLPTRDVDAFAERVAVRSAAVSIRLARSGVWRNGVAALEPRGVVRPLAQLHAALREALVAAGIGVDARAFRPHVTLARDARGSRGPDAFDPIAWQATDYVLAASRGGCYSILRRYPLVRPGDGMVRRAE